MTRNTNRIVTGLLGVLAAVTVFTSAPRDAAAQTAPTACGVRSDLLAHLGKKFGEQRNNMMLDARGNLVEVFSNNETGSWTLTVTVPGGPTCVMSSGESFVQEIRTASVEERGS
jgi:hypothetical protein